MNLRIPVVATLLAVIAGPVWAEDTGPRSAASYSRFELRDVRSKVEVQPKVVDKIARELKLKLDEPLSRWNAEGAVAGRAGTLAIEVEILQMKFVSGGKRVFARAMAGNSSCAVAATLVDVESGRPLVRKVFGEMAGGQKGAFTMGASDNQMLDRIAAAIGNWVIEQYSLPAPAADPEEEAEAESDPAPAAG